MIRADRSAYHGTVAAFPSRAARWLTAGLGALLVGVCGSAPAAAAVSGYDVPDGVVVQIVARGRANEVTVRSWDRPTVQVETDGAPPIVERRPLMYGLSAGSGTRPGQFRPLAQIIPPAAWTTADGGDDSAMQTEEFPFSNMRAGSHQGVRITAEAGAHITVTVPASTAILAIQVGGGLTEIDGYRGANLLVYQGQGRLHIDGTTTTAFAQIATGLLLAKDDTFERVRVRTDTARVTFERCRARQIEASTVTGALTYDGGSFEPGLARFESGRGTIALGVVGGAQLNAHAAGGHVYTGFADRSAMTESRPDGSSLARLGGGGPLVNAISANGDVFLYDGSLRDRRDLPEEWRGVYRNLVTPNLPLRQRVRAVSTPRKRLRHR